MVIKEKLEFKHCNQIYKDPITLICCGGNICKQHINDFFAISNTFNCPFCHQQNQNQDLLENDLGHFKAHEQINGLNYVSTKAATDCTQKNQRSREKIQKSQCTKHGWNSHMLLLPHQTHGDTRGAATPMHVTMQADSMHAARERFESLWNVRCSCCEKDLYRYKCDKKKFDQILENAAYTTHDQNMGHKSRSVEKNAVWPHRHD